MSLLNKLMELTRLTDEDDDYFLDEEDDEFEEEKPPRRTMFPVTRMMKKMRMRLQSLGLSGSSRSFSATMSFQCVTGAWKSPWSGLPLWKIPR